MLRLSIVFVGLIGTQPAAATTPLKADTLFAQCTALIQTPSSAEGRLCDAYLRGFLQGVSSAGGKQRSSTVDESWTDRAARTRLGTTALARASYCVPSDLTVQRFAELFVQQVEANPKTKELDAVSALEATLHVHYRCTASD